MGHLNELQEKYGDKGLTVIAITNEPRGLVDKYVEETGSTHPVIIESTDSAQSWGISGFPSSFLVAPDGKIAFSGHPSGVTEEMIEELLKDAQLFPDVPKSLSSVVKKLEKQDMAGATKLLDKFLAKESLSDEEKTAAKDLVAWIDWRSNSAMEGAQAAYEKGDFYSAAKNYEEVADEFKGLEVGKKAQSALDELLADKDRKREVSAGERYTAAQVKARDMSSKKASKMFASIAKKYEGTRYGELARRMVIKLDNKR